MDAEQGELEIMAADVSDRLRVLEAFNRRLVAEKVSRDIEIASLRAQLNPSRHPSSTLLESMPLFHDSEQEEDGEEDSRRFSSAVKKRMDQLMELATKGESHPPFRRSSTRRHTADARPRSAMRHRRMSTVKEETDVDTVDSRDESEDWQAKYRQTRLARRWQQLRFSYFETCSQRNSPSTSALSSPGPSRPPSQPRHMSYAMQPLADDATAGPSPVTDARRRTLARHSVSGWMGDAPFAGSGMGRRVSVSEAAALSRVKEEGDKEHVMKLLMDSAHPDLRERLEAEKGRRNLLQVPMRASRATSEAPSDLSDNRLSAYVGDAQTSEVSDREHDEMIMQQALLRVARAKEDEGGGAEHAVEIQPSPQFTAENPPPASSSHVPWVRSPKPSAMAADVGHSAVVESEMQADGKDSSRQQPGMQLMIPPSPQEPPTIRRLDVPAGDFAQLSSRAPSDMSDNRLSAYLVQSSADASECGADMGKREQEQAALSETEGPVLATPNHPSETAVRPVIPMEASSPTIANQSIDSRGTLGAPTALSPAASIPAISKNDDRVPQTVSTPLEARGKETEVLRQVQKPARPSDPLEMETPLVSSGIQMDASSAAAAMQDGSVAHSHRFQTIKESTPERETR
ncbi:unnamed protein product [Vitrella brassicaformis CCMP3155]|uniref:Uncharacterized protein n=2 Tax=Vitrella brassicaformis TaxID=1169539 RepID=A0A0G4F9Z5_VITBC|nr:unnamed protein product [Vitrella brassicaformis CCMP3155]|eukprot:CEM09736.1 unnamed protein product [Vitrella brassicaformis CCMP3155]